MPRTDQSGPISVAVADAQTDTAGGLKRSVSRFAAATSNMTVSRTAPHLPSASTAGRRDAARIR